MVQPGRLERRWDSGDALRVGLEIGSAMSPADRAGWAMNVLGVALAVLGVGCAQRPLQDIVTIGSDPARWGDAHAAFQALRRESLRLWESEDDPVCRALMQLAEATAKTVYNASGRSAPFDHDSFARVSQNARSLAEVANDDDLTGALRTAVLRPSGLT